MRAASPNDTVAPKRASTRRQISIRNAYVASTIADAAASHPQPRVISSVAADASRHWCQRYHAAKPTSAIAMTVCATRQRRDGAVISALSLGGSGSSGRAGVVTVVPPIRITGPEAVELSTDLSHLGTLPGDLLAEHADGEENAAEDETRLNDRPHPPLADAIEPEATERHEAGGGADDEDRQAKHTKEQQRFLNEAKLEPDREHVEHADWNAMPRGELRPACVSWVERNGHLRNLESLRRCDNDHVPMPIGSNGKRVHHLAPIRLHRVQVLHLHVEQQTAETIVDPGHERFVVLPLLEAGDHVSLVGQNW